jgi:L-rhamnose mutarotase
MTIIFTGEIPLSPLYLLLDLKNDPELIERYRAWHAPHAVPPAVTKSIRDAGIEDLEIYLVGNRMMMVLTPGPNFNPAEKASADLANPDVQAWENLMWEFQQALPFAQSGEKWLAMERIYALGEQA